MNFYNLIKDEFRKQSLACPSEYHFLYGDTRQYFKAIKHYHGVGPTNMRYSLIEGMVYHTPKKPNEKLISDGIIEIIPSPYNTTTQRLEALFKELPDNLSLTDEEWQLIRLGISMLVAGYNKGNLQQLADGESRLMQAIEKINDRLQEECPTVVKPIETKKPFLWGLMGA